MKEFDLLGGYPEPKKPRYVNQNLRTIKNRIVASYRDKEFFDGERNDGYGGMVYDGRWKSVAKRICEKYEIKDNCYVKVDKNSFYEQNNLNVKNLNN